MVTSEPREDKTRGLGQYVEKDCSPPPATVPGTAGSAPLPADATAPSAGRAYGTRLLLGLGCGCRGRHRQLVADARHVARGQRQRVRVDVDAQHVRAPQRRSTDGKHALPLIGFGLGVAAPIACMPYPWAGLGLHHQW